MLANNHASLPEGNFAQLFYQINQAMLMGSRFDLRMAMYACLPLILLTVFRHPILDKALRIWIFIIAATYYFLGLIELEFYGEFQQRLNNLVFQYLTEDYKTVISMIWNGVPVARYFIGFLVGLFILWGFIKIILPTQQASSRPLQISNFVVIFCLLLISIACARGTFRSGPPLRWGDAYQSEHMFLNHLALNGSYTFAKALMKAFSSKDVSKWPLIEAAEARLTTRKLLFTDKDSYIDDGKSPIKRINQRKEYIDARPKNVVIILMESFSARYVGALGNTDNVTPAFDSLSKEGILFSRFFSNGTHTHQGVFATLASFPNLPGHEYLMQQPEGRNQFSGITKLLPNFKNLFVYNGDFNWDNQLGFFKNQGLTRFVGRHDFDLGQHKNKVWGVPDHLMFERAVSELDELAQHESFVAVLQTMSNHMPYELPKDLDFEPVMIEGKISERLTAMKYSDWSLGQFFKNMRDKPYYDETLFVVLGDHGFAVPDQLTSINLLRFHVPLLFVGNFLEKSSGSINPVVASQVDIVPTIVGMLGESPVQQCWGRNLFNLDQDDEGFAIIKPSGGEPTMAIINGDKILTYDSEQGPNLYEYNVSMHPYAKKYAHPKTEKMLQHQLLSYVQTASNSLRENTTSN